MNAKLPAIAVLLAAVLCGTTGTVQRLAPSSGVSPLALGVVRLAAWRCACLWQNSATEI
ncbi:hypothetical protein KIH86_15810 [Paenibacillus sp. HN-1]|uniref:hypothetical protein n=1 Tax=Paenibacillus TaxID=44249 RepID=UPI001CA7F6BB|nr:MULTISPECIES: hypothetical protein [Paenibacillus]MBY9079385.1 hypothetical protein [Paenibacillus sp. CGMCC 1.18879]MBY9085680.1 hypothetical protein [Paenibacillus sinensis]